MNIDELTLGNLKEIYAFIAAGGGNKPDVHFNNGMIGKYVIVRCHDAGVHAGFLQSHNGRECVLADSRRLWYWKPANRASFLSGVATEGLSPESKIGAICSLIHLTENCEIIECSDIARNSIQDHPAHEQ